MLDLSIYLITNKSETERGYMFNCKGEAGEKIRTKFIKSWKKIEAYYNDKILLTYYNYSKLI